jgi:hypothetical protein
MISLSERTLNPISLYLFFLDGTQLYLTRDNIAQATDNYWKDPSKIPDNVKAAIDFQRCEFCPMSIDKQICDALRPILPLLEHIDKFNSIDPVEVIYASDIPGIFHVSTTTMPVALSYISTLSLIHYCQAGRKFKNYYFDINPLTSPSLLASRLFLNIYWQHRGQREKINHVILEFTQAMKHLCQNQVKRLNLICGNDAFNNAFVNAHVATLLLSLGIEKELQKSLDKYITDF